MKPIAILLLVMSYIMACKKKEALAGINTPTNDTVSVDSIQTVDTPLLRDYMFIPIKDVRWRVHCQGSLIFIQGEYFYDTSYHFFADVESMEEDTLMNAKTYHKFVAEINQVYNNIMYAQSLVIFTLMKIL